MTEGETSEKIRSKRKYDDEDGRDWSLALELVLMMQQKMEKLEKMSEGETSEEIISKHQIQYEGARDWSRVLELMLMQQQKMGKLEAISEGETSEEISSKRQIQYEDARDWSHVLLLVQKKLQETEKLKTTSEDETSETIRSFVFSKVDKIIASVGLDPAGWHEGGRVQPAPINNINLYHNYRMFLDRVRAKYIIDVLKTTLIVNGVPRSPPPPEFANQVRSSRRPMTPQEMQSYSAMMQKSQGFDLDYYPYILEDIIQPVPLDDMVAYSVDYDCFLHLAVAKYNSDQPSMICFPIFLKANRGSCGSLTVHYITFHAVDCANLLRNVYEAVLYQSPSSKLSFCHFCRVAGSKIIPPMPFRCLLGLFFDMSSSQPPPVLNGLPCPRSRRGACYSWFRGFRNITGKEYEAYVAKAKESQGFDVPLVPGVRQSLLKPVQPKGFESSHAQYEYFLQISVAYYNANQPTGICYPRILKAMFIEPRYEYFITFEALDCAAGIFKVYEAIVLEVDVGLLNSVCRFCRIRGSRIIPLEVASNYRFLMDDSLPYSASPISPLTPAVLAGCW